MVFYVCKIFLIYVNKTDHECMGISRIHEYFKKIDLSFFVNFTYFSFLCALFKTHRVLVELMHFR